MLFTYCPIVEHGKDLTEYKWITSEGIRVEDVGGKPLLVVEPEVLERLAFEAFFEVSFFLRSAHLKQVAAILENPLASENDRFVARAFLENAVIAAEGALPSCQDTGTAIVVAEKGQRVLTDFDERAALSNGIFRCFEKYNLRYSQMAPLGMFEEQNTGNNLPAQIDIQSVNGMAYRFTCIAKGGGSANKTFLYQKTKSLLTEGALRDFLKQELFHIGTAACPPYHLAIVIGGLSAEMTLKYVKLASVGDLDDLPTSGDGSGRAFRDLEWEQRVLDMSRETGIGAQFGGACFCHDVRVIRLPRHAASCPVGIGVSCSADRNIRAKITEEGLFIEKLEHDPLAYFSSAKASDLSEDVAIDLNRPMDEICEVLSAYPILTRFRLTGTLIVARDVAHARIKEMLDAGQPLPEYLKKYPVYYAGPAKTPEGKPSGSFGPTTAQRMDPYVAVFMQHGGSRVMLAKGNRDQCVIDACEKYNGFYLGSLGGPAALLAEKHIRSVEVVDFPELGMEAVRKIEVVDFPAVLLTDNKGNDFFATLGLA